MKRHDASGLIHGHHILWRLHAVVHLRVVLLRVSVHGFDCQNVSGDQRQNVQFNSANQDNSIIILIACSSSEFFSLMLHFLLLRVKSDQSRL